MNINTPRVFRPSPEQVKNWTRTIEVDPSKVLMFYVGTQCIYPVTMVEERLRDAGMNMEHVRVFQPEPEDGEFFEELRARKGIGAVIEDREEDPHNIFWDMEADYLGWVFYGGSESDTVLELDDRINSGQDIETLFINLVEDYRTGELLECFDYLDCAPEEVLEPLEEYPYLAEALGTLWTEIAIRANY